LIYTLAELIKELNFENKRKYSPLKVISCLKEREEVTAAGTATAGFGCAYIIFQIFIFILGIYLLFKLGSWLFG